MARNEGEGKCNEKGEVWFDLRWMGARWVFLVTEF